MADPGVPRRGAANIWVWLNNLLFGKIFAENCMKMKEIWLKGSLATNPALSINQN